MIKCVLFQSDNDCGPFFNTKERKGWLECWHAIVVTRNALLSFVETIIDTLFNQIIQILPKCKAAASAGSSAVLKHDCYMDAEITKYNLLQPPKAWKNADRKKWCNSPWELAKCFIHAQGYKSKTSFSESDINALLSILKNCRVFQPYFVSSPGNVVDDESVFKCNNTQNVCI